MFKMLKLSSKSDNIFNNYISSKDHLELQFKNEMKQE